MQNPVRQRQIAELKKLRAALAEHRADVIAQLAARIQKKEHA